MNLDALAPGATLRGLVPDVAVTVVSVTIWPYRPQLMRRADRRTEGACCNDNFRGVLNRLLLAQLDISP
jgi:hypothetical protein